MKEAERHKECIIGLYQMMLVKECLQRREEGKNGQEYETLREI
jgi:hypothetical protein